MDMTCVICTKAAATIGALCEKCRGELVGPLAITPEQIAAKAPSGAVGAMIDQWGRPHRIGPKTTVGRTEDSDLTILSGCVSRKHAEITFERGSWRLRDLGSLNGTIVGEQAVKGTVTLADRSKVRFSGFGFYFCRDATRWPRSQQRRPAMKTAPMFERARTLDADVDADVVPTVTIVFQQPTGGGVGVVAIDGTSLQLTLAQFELLEILAERMVSDTRSPRETRGFVDAPRLLELLSLDSTDPGEDSVRQLVRRVRRVLAGADLQGMIESKQRLGYRLAAIPNIKRKR